MRLFLESVISILHIKMRKNKKEPAEITVGSFHFLFFLYKRNIFFHTVVYIFPFFPYKPDFLMDSRGNGNTDQPGQIFHQRRIEECSAQMIADKVPDGKELAGMHDHVWLDSGTFEARIQSRI